MKDIVILGAGGFGREIAWLIEDINSLNRQWNLIGFLDPTGPESSYPGAEIIGKDDFLESYQHDIWVVVALGNPLKKEKVVNGISHRNNIHYATLIHPSVSISKSVNIDCGVVICAGSILTVDMHIASFVTINLLCTIGHDSEVNEFSSLMPAVNVSGKVTIGRTVFLGTGVKIIENKRIGDGSIIGAGSVVVDDIPDFCTAVGVPAKPIKFHSRG
ncbi:MAG: acetyltransferase [Candidatus Taylorbacteria bacterium]|nr:acetyltransferase [Candidatus Taylorbacteria bacterium]